MAAVLRVRVKVKVTLFSLGDWFCAWAGAGTDEGVTRPWLFWAGHQVSELGWRFR